MLLMADGSDNCSANICATANLIARRSPQTRIHVIGLGKTSAVNRLSCVSKATNGIFTAVETSAENGHRPESYFADRGYRQRTSQTDPGRTGPPAPTRSASSCRSEQFFKTAARHTIKFPKTVPLPVRSPARLKATKVLAQAQTEPETAAMAAPLQTDGPLTTATSGAQAVRDAKDDAPVLWQKITEKPTVIAEAPTPATAATTASEKPDVKPVAPPSDKIFLGNKPSIEITLPETSAKVKFGALITEQGKAIESGLFWRIYKSRKDEDGRYKLVKTLEAPRFDDQLPLGVYLVNLSWGRSHLTEKTGYLVFKTLCP